MSVLNSFVAGADGGPVFALDLGATLDRLAGSEISDLHPTGVNSGSLDAQRFGWSGSLLDWLNFVDRCSELAKASDDEDLSMVVRWLDEDLDLKMRGLGR